MCIRDRCSTASDLSEAIEAADPARQRRNGDEARIGDVLVLPCLLYTSDAADERSSVDLGGRRILKKKKEREEREREREEQQTAMSQHHRSE